MLISATNQYKSLPITQCLYVFLQLNHSCFWLSVLTRWSDIGYLTVSKMYLTYLFINQCIPLTIIQCLSAAKPFLFLASSNMTRWSDICFNLLILINVMVALFYPFKDGPSGKRSYFFGAHYSDLFVQFIVNLCYGAPI